MEGMGGEVAGSGPATTSERAPGLVTGQEIEDGRQAHEEHEFLVK